MRQIGWVVALLLAMTIAGTVGYRILTGASWLDSAYQAVVTLTTVGSREPFPLTDGVKKFTIFYLIFGLGVFTYSGYQLGQLIFNLEMRSLLERRRMEKNISKLENHFIVCGQGRMGGTICEYLHSRGEPFVVVDFNEEMLEEQSKEKGWLYVVGDATNDDVLIRAGIKNARALTSVLPTDADNVYVVLSARMLSPDVKIIARASEEKAVEKLERAGATRTVSPFNTGAVKMARFMLNPSIEDFLEIADSKGNELELADVLITEHSPYVGMRLMDTDLTDKGVMIIGIRRESGERLMPPAGTAVIHAGDSLFAFGGSESVNAMIGESFTDD